MSRFLLTFFLVNGTLFAQTDSLENPFSKTSRRFDPVHIKIEKVTDPLRTQLAHALIESVFEAEGIDLQKKYQFTVAGVAVPLSGYDPERKIGYLWLARYLAQRESGEEKWRRQWRAELEKMGGKDFLQAKLKVIAHQARAPYYLTADSKRLLSARKDKETRFEIKKNIEIYEQNLRRQDSTQLSMRELRILDSLQQTGEIRIALIHAVDLRFKYLRDQSVRNQQEENAVGTVEYERNRAADRKEREDAMFRLQEAVRTYIQWVKKEEAR